MKHIPTTETTVRKIKAAAKRIRDEQELQLSQAQDLAAQAAGYDHFHHAITCAANTQPTIAPFSGLGQLQFQVEQPAVDWPTYDDDGNETGQVRCFAGTFVAWKKPQSLDSVTDDLDELLEEVEGGMGDMTLIRAAGLNKIITRCRKLTTKEPAFLDGYAHWAGALVALNRGAECIALARPVYEAALALVPYSFRGFIPYPYLENRPFHRLALNLLLAYDQNNQVNEAKGIAMTMLKWWPNDNIGFRLLLSDFEEFGRIKQE